MTDGGENTEDNIQMFLWCSLNVAAEFIRQEDPLTFHRAGSAQINRCTYEIFKIDMFTEIFNSPPLSLDSESCSKLSVI